MPAACSPGLHGATRALPTRRTRARSHDLGDARPRITSTAFRSLTWRTQVAASLSTPSSPPPLVALHGARGVQICPMSASGREEGDAATSTLALAWRGSCICLLGGTPLATLTPRPNHCFPSSYDYHPSRGCAPIVRRWEAHKLRCAIRCGALDYTRQAYSERVAQSRSAPLHQDGAEAAQWSRSEDGSIPRGAGAVVAAAGVDVVPLHIIRCAAGEASFRALGLKILERGQYCR
ncbi:hypothetical protein K438DRAFT_2000110 [Mycena galopus ATCC 62051]|nr:hypothetical protein K438DRAFT_2000110 [Mycena galopus ATCC 62051]